MQKSSLFLSIAIHGSAVSAALGLAVYAHQRVTPPPAQIELRQQVASVAQQAQPQPVPDVASEDVRVEPTMRDLVVEPDESPVEEPVVETVTWRPSPSAVMQRATLDRVVPRKSPPPVEPVEELPEPVATQQSQPQAAVNSEARRTDNVAPDYPERERRRGYEGTVVLRVAVAADGSVEKVSLLTPSRYAGFNRAALKAARKWNFEAAKCDGVPVASTTDIEVVFELEAKSATN